MKTLYTFLLLLAAFTAAAQTSCPYYKELIQKGDAEMEKGNPDYKTAMNQYNAAMLHCPANADEAQKRVLSVFKRIEDLKNVAEKAKNRADSLAGVAKYQLIQTQMKQKEVEKALHKTDSALSQVQIQQAKNKKIIDASYFYADRFGITTNKDKQYGFINKEGDPLIGYNYGYAQPFDERTGFAIVKKWYSEASFYYIDTLANEYKLGYEPSKDSTITALDLRWKTYDSIPSEVFKMRQLKILLLGDNHIKKIPPQMKNLVNLVYLDLSNNPITLIENLDSLQKLKVIDISGTYDYTYGESTGSIVDLNGLKHLKKIEKINAIYNKIKDLEAIKAFDSLKILIVSFNQINSLEDVQQLKNLRTLDVYKNNIREIAYLENLSKLEKLNIGWNDDIDTLKGLENLSNLKTLLAAFNHIQHIKGLSCTKKLQVLDLGGNEIKIISGLDSLRNLQKLILSDNKIQAINQGLRHVKHLEYLDLDKNPIQKLDGLATLKDLYYFSFNWDRIIAIDSIPDSPYWANIEKLDLSSKKLSKLPIGFEKLINLKELYLSSNSFVEIPPQVGKLSKLQYLSIYYNEIRELKHLENLTALQNLDFDWDAIDYLPKFPVWANITYLDLSGKSLQKLPVGFSQLINLTKLNLNDNKLKIIPPQISTLTKLTKLYILYNEIRELKNLENLTSLQTFNISGNQIRELKNLENLTALQIFGISENKIDTLKNLDNLKALQTFSISQNQIRELKNLENLTSLQNFYISTALITDTTSLKSFAKIIKDNTDYIYWIKSCAKDSNYVLALTIRKGIQNKNLDLDYGSLSWWLIFCHDFEGAIWAGEKYIENGGKEIGVLSNLAMGYLYHGDYDKAYTIYAKYKNEKDDSGLGKDIFLKDLEEVATKNVPPQNPADVAKIKAFLQAE